MSTGEHKCIRYLMKEMDPSEELEFEYLMREDENLLIEVESLRATFKKTSQLPLKNPPEFLTQNVLNDLKALQSSSSNKKHNLFVLAAKSLAAAVVIAALSGSYFYFWQSEEAMPANPAVSETVQPWVDRDEVIRLPMQVQTPAAAQSQSAPVPVNQVRQTWNREFEQSYQKLQLVKFYNNQPGSYNGFHLTGTSE